MRDVEEIELTNLEWLEYMKGFDGENITKCPLGHPLYWYRSPVDEDTKVITCINISCKYYDYHTYRVPMGWETPNIERLIF